MQIDHEIPAHDYDTDSKEAGWDSPERVQKLVESRVIAASKVLDIGIGTGLAVSGYADKGATVIGLDHDQAMLDTAQTVVGEHGSLRQADINGQLPIDDLKSSVDVAQAVGKPRKTTPFSASKKSRRGKSQEKKSKGGGFFGWAGRRPARLSNFCAKIGSSAVVELRQQWTNFRIVARMGGFFFALTQC